MDVRNFTSQVRQFKQLEMHLGKDFSDQVQHLMELRWNTVMSEKPSLIEQAMAWQQIDEFLTNEYLPRHPDLKLNKPEFQSSFL